MYMINHLARPVAFVYAKSSTKSRPSRPHYTPNSTLPYSSPESIKHSLFFSSYASKEPSWSV